MKIREIELLTDDVDGTTEFYSEILGFKLINADQHTVSFSAGQSVLTFTKSGNLNPKYHFAFNIPCNKIDEAVLWVSSRTELIRMADERVIADFESWHAQAIYFYDNNGNILEFIARRDLNNLSGKDFTISDVQSISEIGIVADNPLELAGKLISENKLPYFSKGEKSDTFVALGDDNGLFIIVKTNRNWYPTTVPAGKFLTKIKLNINNGEAEIILNESNAHF